MSDTEKSFRVLGLEMSASAAQVREAYKDLVQVWHPDRFAHNEKLRAKAQEQLKEINVALQRVQKYLESPKHTQHAHQESTVSKEQQEREEAIREAKRRAEDQARSRAKAAYEAEMKRRSTAGTKPSDQNLKKSMAEKLGLVERVDSKGSSSTKKSILEQLGMIE